MLAIQHLHKQTKNSETENKKELKPEPTQSTEDKNIDIKEKEGAGDVNKSNDIAKMDIEKLRKECLKILESKSFNDEAKSYLLTGNTFPSHNFKGNGTLELPDMGTKFL